MIVERATTPTVTESEEQRSYAQAILYAVYFILSIVGIVKWKKGETKNDS